MVVTAPLKQVTKADILLVHFQHLNTFEKNIYKES